MYRRSQTRDLATRFLVTINVAIFLIQLTVGVHGFAIQTVFGLSESRLWHGAFWQLVTYQFLHANELHIFVNMLGLWLVGRELEPWIGTPKFVALYLMGGICGGLLQVLFSSSPLIGASGSVCAIFLAFITLFPSQPITALLFFVLPIRMRARMLGYILVAGSILFWLSGWQPKVGHLAHLGGFLTGWIFGMIFRGQYRGEVPRENLPV